MDPLSIASAISGLIMLSAKILADGWSFVHAVNDAPRSLSSLLTEMGLINLVLDQIQALAKRAASDNMQTSPSNPALHALLQAHDVGECQEILNGIDETISGCRQLDGQWVKNAGKRALWTLRERDVKNMLTRLTSIQHVLETALSVDAAGSLQRIEKRLGDFATDNDDAKRRRLCLDHKIDEMREEQSKARKEVDDRRRVKQREKILQWLSPGHFDSNRQRDLRQKRAIGSGEWFFSMDEWIRWFSGEANIFWCRAGTGKSFLTSKVRDYLAENEASREAGIAQIYFDYTKQADQTVEKVVARILKELVSQQTQLHHQIIALYEGSSNELPSIDDLLSGLLLVAREFRQVFILLDGLDSCDDETRKAQILPAIKYASQQSESMQFFITSRPHVAAFGVCFQSLVEFDLSANPADIDLLVRSSLIGQKDMDSEFIEEVQHTLSESAQGLMLLVSFQLQYILEQPNKRKKREALHAMPANLDKIYERAVETIQKRIASCRALAFRTLLWVMYAVRPLKVEELQEAVAIEEGDTAIDNDSLTDPDTLVEICAGLVVIDRVSGIFRLSHSTVGEFLRCRVSMLEGAHFPKWQIADTCLTYLSFDWCDQSCIKSSTESELKKRLEANKFLEFTAKNWHLYLETPSGLEGKLFCDTLFTKVERLLESQQRLQAIFQVVLYGTEHHTYGYHLNSNSSFSPLHGAAIWGLDDVVGRHLEGGGFDPNARDDRGRTALSWAAEFGWTEVVRLLLRRTDVDVNAVDLAGRSPLWWAARKNQVECLRLLLAAPNSQPDQKDHNQRTPLLRAAMKGGDGCVKQLLESESVDPTSRDREGRCPLWWACRNGRTEVVKLLIGSERLPSDTQDEFGQTPLIRACIRGTQPVVKMLLETDLDVNCRDRQGMTALSWLARSAWSGSGHETVAIMLLGLRDLDVNSKDNDGRTALMWAEKRGNQAIAELISARSVHLDMAQVTPTITADSKSVANISPLNSDLPLLLH